MSAMGEYTAIGFSQDSLHKIPHLVEQIQRSVMDIRATFITS